MGNVIQKIKEWEKEIADKKPIELSDDFIIDLQFKDRRLPDLNGPDVMVIANCIVNHKNWLIKTLDKFDKLTDEKMRKYCSEYQGLLNRYKIIEAMIQSEIF